MKKIAISNHKGGVGKTTSCINIGARLAILGKKVLLLDIDPQSNLSSAFGLQDAKLTIYNAFMGQCALPIYQVKENLFLCPSCLDLAAADIELSSRIMRETILKKLIEPIGQEYDFIIIDCPPSLGILSINAFAAADEVFIPVQAEMFSTAGIERLLKVISEVKHHINPNLTIGGVFTTLYDNRLVLHRDIAQSLKEVFTKGEVLNTVIRRTVALSEAQTQEKAIYDYSPASNGAKDYEALTEEICTKI